MMIKTIIEKYLEEYALSVCPAEVQVQQFNTS